MEKGLNERKINKEGKIFYEMDNQKERDYELFPYMILKKLPICCKYGNTGGQPIKAPIYFLEYFKKNPYNSELTFPSFIVNPIDEKVIKYKNKK